MTDKPTPAQIINSTFRGLNEASHLLPPSAHLIEALANFGYVIVEATPDEIPADDEGFLCPNWVSPHYRCLRPRGHSGNCKIELLEGDPT